MTRADKTPEAVITLDQLIAGLKQFEGQVITNAVGLAVTLVTGAAPAPAPRPGSVRTTLSGQDRIRRRQRADRAG